MNTNNPVDSFSRLGHRYNFPIQQPQTLHEREIVMMEEEDYYFTRASNGGHYYGQRSSGKKWSAFIIACIDLGCGCVCIFLEGRTLIIMLTLGLSNILISCAACSLILSLLWFIAAWKLLESAYLRKRVMERYELAKFWRITNICLLFIFMLASVIVLLCLYGSCEIGLGVDTMKILQSDMFRLLFLLWIIFTWMYRVFVIWRINKYINELYSDLSIDSLPLQML